MTAHLHGDIPVRRIAANCVHFAFVKQRQPKTFRVWRFAAAVDPGEILFRIETKMAQHNLRIHARAALEIPCDLAPLEIRNILHVRLGHEHMGGAVSDGHDIDFAVDVIAVFQD